MSLALIREQPGDENVQDEHAARSASVEVELSKQSSSKMKFMRTGLHTQKHLISLLFYVF